MAKTVVLQTTGLQHERMQFGTAVFIQGTSDMSVSISLIDPMNATLAVLSWPTVELTCTLFENSIRFTRPREDVFNQRNVSFLLIDQTLAVAARLLRSAERA